MTDRNGEKVGRLGADGAPTNRTLALDLTDLLPTATSAALTA